MQNKTKQHFFLALTAKLLVEQSTPVLIAQKAQQLWFQYCNESKMNVVSVCAGLNEATCYEVPVCYTVKYKQASVGMERRRRRKKSGIKCVSPRILGDKIQTSLFEEKPQEPLGWRAAKHLTLSSAGSHSSPPSIFVFSSHLWFPPFTSSLPGGLVPPLFLLCMLFSSLFHFSLLFNLSL